MFKKLKLGAKIGLGFAAVLMIAAVLGIVAIVQMNMVEEQSVMLQKEYVPEVEIANRVERSSFRTMYAMRGYGLTGNQAMLEDAQANIKALEERLNEANKLADASANLKALRPAVEKIQKELSIYQGLVNETVKVNNAMEQNRSQLDTAAGRYMENATAFLHGQEKKLKDEISRAFFPERLLERQSKVTLVNDVIDIGNATRLAVWRAQAQRDPEILKAANANFAIIAQKLNDLRKITVQTEDLTSLKEIEDAGNSYQQAMNSYLENFNINRGLGGKRDEAGTSVVSEARNVAIAGMEGTQRIAEGGVSALHMANNIMIAGLILALLIGALIAWLITRSITGPILRGVNLTQEIAKGDFSMRLNMDRQDEIGILANALDGMADNLSRNADVAEQIADGNLNVEVHLASEKDQLGLALQTMVVNLNDILGQIQVAGEQIASGSGQVADSSQALSQGATESASSLEEISSSLNQLSSQTGTNAENANTANQLSAEARSAAEQGSRKMQEMVAAMTEINDAGQSISKIIKVIDEIAFQTNLLALNAAVEAARAGQHGKGFAVVAEEVRNLAARSAKAAAETSELIEGSVQKTANGTTIAGQTAEALQSIVNGIGKVTDLVAEIAAASSEQAQGVSQINQGITQIDQVTQQNTASAEESAAASEELSSQAAQMREMLMRFTLKHGSSVHSNVRAVPQKSAAAKSSGWGESAPAQTQQKIAAKKPIALDDDEFGKY